jgi:hypothetical protein
MPAGVKVVKIYQATPTGRDIHFDVPLSNIAVQQFATGEQQGYVGMELFKPVPVDKQSNRYYVIDKNSWFLLHDTRRAPKTSPNRIEFRVSSDAYFAQNYALAGEIPNEDLANQDAAVQLYETTVQLVTEALQRDLERRIVNLVTSISNVGSGVVLAGANQWSDYINSNPIADVTTAHAFAVQNTGLVYNTMVLPWDVFQVVRRHPLLLDLFKYTQGGMLNEEQLRAVFNVDRILIPRAIVNNAPEGAPASFTMIWGDNVLLAYVSPQAPSLRTVTFGLAFQWKPEGFPAPFAVRRYPHWDPGVASTITDVQYYQAEKIVAPQLAYVIRDTLA